MLPFVPSKPLAVLLGVSLCGVSGYLVYYLLKKEERSKAGIDTTVKVVHIAITKDCVKLLYGRNGMRLGQVQLETNTEIEIHNREDADGNRQCTIRGKPEGVYLAQDYIEKTLNSITPPACEIIWVPTSIVGRIIGRCGERINEIISLSGARIYVDDETSPSPSHNKKRIVLRGSSPQVTVAKSLIEDIVQNTYDESEHLAKRLPRTAVKKPTASSASKEEVSPKVERLSSGPGHSDAPFEVYVSAMIDPSRFWLQIVGPKAKELDLLVEEMTEFYGNAENRDLHQLEGVGVGDLVAATFPYDHKWYRAEVLSIAGDDAELYYVDYGDTDRVAMLKLYELRTDFLRLHFQAIECFLARVAPKGEMWAEEAIDKFEEWTHVAQWRKLSAKVHEYCVREKTRAKREGSPVPGVDLFDLADEGDVDIAHELVAHGFASYTKSTTTTTTSTSTSPVPQANGSSTS